MDVHVSLLCDVSGSMSANMGALGAATTSIATGCHNVGVGCDVVLFSDGIQTYRLGQDEAMEYIQYPAMGGTDPTKALQDLDNHELADHVTNHLVIIFTDGAWQGAASGDCIPNYKDNEQGVNRFFVTANYGAYVRDGHGADRTVQLQEVVELPRLLEEALSDLLGEKG
jgi:hypothetical protein